MEKVSCGYPASVRTTPVSEPEEMDLYSSMTFAMLAFSSRISTTLCCSPSLLRSSIRREILETRKGAKACLFDSWFAFISLIRSLAEGDSGEKRTW